MENGDAFRRCTESAHHGLGRRMCCGRRLARLGGFFFFELISTKSTSSLKRADGMATLDSDAPSSAAERRSIPGPWPATCVEEGRRIEPALVPVPCGAIAGLEA